VGHRVIVIISSEDFVDSMVLIRTVLIKQKEASLQPRHRVIVIISSEDFVDSMVLILFS
jgi:hypothetical protein